MIYKAYGIIVKLSLVCNDINKGDDVKIKIIILKNIYGEPLKP